MVGEDRAAVVDSVTIRILEHADYIIRLGGHLFSREGVSGGFAQKQPAPIINGSHHGIIHEPGSGDFFHSETTWYLNRTQSRVRKVRRTGLSACSKYRRNRDFNPNCYHSRTGAVRSPKPFQNHG